MVRMLLVLVVLTTFNNCSFAYNLSDLNSLNRAEYFLFGRNNPNLPPQARLAMTEQRLFGTIQHGTFNERVNFVNKVLANSANDPFYNANINKIRKTNRIKNALNNVMNGSMTGYTPAIPYGTANFYNNRPFYYHNTKIPQPMNSYGNFITQTRILFDD